MVTDQEPRYRLVDADGNVVGSLFAESDGTLKLQEGTSGDDNELSLTTQGALEVERQSITGNGEIMLLPNETGQKILQTRDKQQSIGASEQLRLRFEGVSTSTQLFEIKFHAFGPSANAAALRTAYVFDTRSSSFTDKSQDPDPLLISFSSTDYSLSHTGQGSEFDLIIKNNTPNTYGKWALLIDNIGSGATPNLKTTTVENQ